MRRKSRRGNDEANIDMTPMLDIVFILLIFFIVTATFLQEEGIDLTPPPETDQPPPPDAPPPIFVQVSNENRVFVNRDATAESRVMAAVSRIRAEQPNSAVVIEVSQEAEHGTIVRIIDELRANSIPVSISRAGEQQ
ncbi:MAG: biopolymer transporter ExbD [Oceanicaulis sp.]